MANACGREVTLMVSVLVIGEFEAQLPEKLLADVLPTSTCTVDCLRVADADGALRLIQSGRQPELVVLNETRVGQVSHTAINLLRQAAPLARFWRRLGSWCEGEARSGNPPAGCLTSTWHQWAPRMARQMAVAASGARPLWSLPTTASPDERLLADQASQQRIDHPTVRQATGRGTIVICASAAPAAGALADLCRGHHYRTTIVAEGAVFRTDGATAVLWDTTCRGLAECRQIDRLRRSTQQAPIVALVGFPRAEDIEAAQRAGVAAVVAKPFLAADLFWELDRLLPASLG
jgi:CheY-like chemotaxis protein